MATVGSMALTLNDLMKRMEPDGRIAEIMEVLNLSNPILEHMTWMEGNLTTGNKSTLRSSLTTPQVRYINRGVKNTKSGTTQISDTSVILEDRSEVDEELLAMAPDPEAFRRSEDAAHIEGFGQKVANMVIYGNTADSPDTFNGLDIRHRLFNVNDPTKQGYTTANLGGTGSVTSAYFVDWSDKTCTGFYPKGSTAGLKFRDLGEQTLEDADGNKYQGQASNFKWKVGLAVRDYRAIGALRNINPETLITGTATQKLDLIRKFVTIHDRLRHPEKVVLYTDNSFYSALKVFLMDKNNSFVTRETLQNGIEVLKFDGVRVVKLDAISGAETALD